MSKKILVANRGEIAVRVMRTAKEMGYKTVAIYSAQDENAYHVRYADEAYYVGEAPSAQSYLNTEAILKAIKDSGADMVHPGYGFYSENSDFVRTLEDEGVIFIGPGAKAIEAMGDKISAREVASKANVSMVPGTSDPIKNTAEIVDFGKKHGFPIAIKAAYGGGGRGMRVVFSPDEIEEAFQAASREAENYFGRSETYLEKYLVKPRHVEVQIFGDSHGNYVHLSTRDCSVQRRHQKLIEEAPAPFISKETEKLMGEQAIAVAKACGYKNAGTVEMLYVPEREGNSEEFYFLEMNTRLQVEHCVSEEITGFDFVREQINVALGNKLSFKQKDIVVSGHSIECRVNAENTHLGFAPSPGTIAKIEIAQGLGVRYDGGYQNGDEISQYYDNLAGKLIVWAPTRDEAIKRLGRAIDETKITGIHHTLLAQKEMILHDDFIAGDHHTKWVEEDLNPDTWPETTVDLSSVEVNENEKVLVPVEINGKLYEVKVQIPDGLSNTGGNKKSKPKKAIKSGASLQDQTGSVTAPMQGTIISVSAELNQEISKGDTLCILEAMKMENQIKSPQDGKIKDVLINQGDLVGAGDVLFIFE